MFGLECASLLFLLNDALLDAGTDGESEDGGEQGEDAQGEASDGQAASAGSLENGGHLGVLPELGGELGEIRHWLGLGSIGATEKGGGSQAPGVDALRHLGFGERSLLEAIGCADVVHEAAVW